jgi:hypothetical protein
LDQAIASWAALVLRLVLRLAQEKSVAEADAPRPAAGKKPPLGTTSAYSPSTTTSSGRHSSPISVLVERYRAKAGNGEIVAPPRKEVPEG